MKAILNKLFLNVPVNTKLLVFFLMLMFVDYAGYGYYIFYLTFFYLFYHKAFRLVDGMFFLLLTWGISYGFTNYINTKTISYSTVLLPIINCPVLYLAGKYVARYNDIKSLPVLLYYLALSIALISLLSVFQDIAKNGFFVIGGERNIPLIGVENIEGYIAATGISSRLMLLASFFVFVMLPYSWLKKIVFVLGAFLAIYCAMRVQSRTTVVGLALIFFTIVIWSWKSLSKKQKWILFLGVGVIVYAIFYILSHYSEELAIIDRFQTDEIETGGGRTYRLLNVASHMLDYPIGGMGTEITYAHNLWFDCARVAGILPFVLLIIIALKYAFCLFQVIRNNLVDLILRYTFWILSLAILIVFLSEPVLEGIPMVFEFFCFLYGILIYCIRRFVFYKC